MSRSLSFLRRHSEKIVLLLLLLLISIPTACLIWASDQIASPTRRKLAGYHRDYLSNPASHGIRIERFTASDGTPCLVCTPDPSATLAKRGLLLREQLSAKGITLPAPGSVIGNLVLLHGRTGRKEDYLPVAERFCSAGFRCIIPDLPAHGENPSPFTTYGIREATIPQRVLSEAAATFRFPSQPCALVGMSMGGSVAIHAAALPDAPWKSLIILCSYDSFPAVVRGNISHKVGDTLADPAFAAIATLYQKRTGIDLDTIQPHRLAKGIRQPVLIAHGTDDLTIPLPAGHRLFQAFPEDSQKTWIEIPHANHNNILVTPYPLYSEMTVWLLGHLTP